MRVSPQLRYCSDCLGYFRAHRCLVCWATMSVRAKTPPRLALPTRRRPARWTRHVSGALDAPLLASTPRPLRSARLLALVVSFRAGATAPAARSPARTSQPNRNAAPPLAIGSLHAGTHQIRSARLAWTKPNARGAIVSGKERTLAFERNDPLREHEPHRRGWFHRQYYSLRIDNCSPP